VVRFDGCTAVRRLDGQTTCIAKLRTDIVLWAENTLCDDLLFTESGAAVEVPTKLVQGGCQARVPVGQSSAVSRLEVLSAKTGEVLLGLQLDRSQPNFLARTARMKVRAIPDLSEAESDYYNKITPSISIEDRLDLTYALAVSYQRLGQLDAANKIYAQLRELADSAGYQSIAIAAQVATAQIFIDDSRITDAKAVLAKATAATQLIPGASAVAIDLQYAVATETQTAPGSVEVLEYFKRVYAISEGLRNTDILSLTAARLVGAFNDLKRFDEAKQVLPAMSAMLVGASDCERAKILSNQATLGMNLVEASNSMATPILIGDRLVRDILEDALASRKKCLSVPSLIRIQVSRARLALLEQRWADVHDAVLAGRELPGFGNMAYQMLSMQDYEAQRVLRIGEHQEALRLFTELARQADAIPGERVEFLIRAAIGKLEALRMMNKSDSAAIDLLRAWLQNRADQPPAIVGNISRRFDAVTH
jgi:tetratricopeptide (TPR) repeat protein